MFLQETINTEADIFEGVEPSSETLLDIMVESEITYGNLVRRMMALEHKAIVTEDSALLQEGIGQYWDAFIKALQKFWKRVKAWFVSLYNRIAAALGSDSALEARAKEVFAKDNPSVKVKLPGNWKNAKGTLTSAISALKAASEGTKEAGASPAEQAESEEQDAAATAKASGEGASFLTEAYVVLGNVATVSTDGNAILKAFSELRKFVPEIAKKCAKSCDDFEKQIEAEAKKKDDSLKSKIEADRKVLGKMVSRSSKLVADGKACYGALRTALKTAISAAKTGKSEKASSKIEESGMFADLV